MGGANADDDTLRTMKNNEARGKFLSKLAGVEVSTKMDVQKNDILYYYSYVKKRDLDSRPTAAR